MPLDRRQLLTSAATLAAAAHPGARALAQGMPVEPALGPRVAFSFDALKSWAQLMGASPYRAPLIARPDILEAIDFDAHQRIRFRADRTIRIDRDGRYPLQLFHPGKYFKEPVRIFRVEAGEAREVLYQTGLFDMPGDHVARGLPDGGGFAGFRLMDREIKTDWISFLGASYFRTSGPYNQYGLSARGLSIDTGLDPEEFPRFTNFWLEDAGGPASALVVYALLESPSVTGAYRVRTERTTDARDIHRITHEIECELFARRDIGRLGIAPFSSMFWYGEASRRQASDWRPEIHDSDGLAIWTGAGERIWRPLNNPPKVMTNTFVDRDIRGFGLLQRDRDFVHYLDDGVFYERRASVWVEPLDPWGPGAVHLLEIPTDDEVHDNIAAYWCPDEPFRAGTTRRYRYRLTWLDDIAFPEALGRATATWTGMGGVPGQKRPAGTRKFVIDWQGPAFARLGRNDGVEIVVTVSRGSVGQAYTHPVADQRERWRAIFDVQAAGAEPVDMRAFLRRDGRPLTERWLYQYFPEA